MKIPPLFRTLFALALSLAPTAARAQFPNFPAADKVLGATDFTSVGPATATPSEMDVPSGVAIDPLTGKLFVSAQSQHRILRFPSPAGLPLGANAESVFGQVNFGNTFSGTTASTFDAPSGLHIDKKGRLWVADFSNNRVLMFQGASTLGFAPTADRVFGQPNFTTVTAGTTAAKMSSPIHAVVDSEDNLWVVEYGNSRVLKFANVSSLANGASATTVLGQPNFTTATVATSATKMSGPAAVATDDAGHLWVAELGNNRVLRFDNAGSLGSGAAASAVLGQIGFTSSTSGTTAQNLNAPSALLVDPAGTLYVAELANDRVLIFKNAVAKANGAAAEGVIGQPDLTTATGGTSERKLDGPIGGIALDAAGRLWVVDQNNDRLIGFPADRTATPPKLTGKTPKTTTAATLPLRGTATDPNGVARVKYRVGKGAFRNAIGTTAWRLTARLKPGKNTLEIVTVDTVGNTSAPKRVKVTRL